MRDRDATGLWRKTSAKGNEFFVGRRGGVKVLVLENRDKQSDRWIALSLREVDPEFGTGGLIGMGSAPSW